VLYCEAETSKRLMSGVQAIGILSLLKTRYARALRRAER
jgi:hypothetical protein